MKERRTQVSVFLEPKVLAAAKQRASDMNVSMSAAVAEAAKESLLSSYRSEREQEILKAVERNFHTLRRLESRLRLDVQVLKEMVGLGMRSFFNHTTPIPESTKAAALLSGKQRFQRYLDGLARNLRTGESILSDLPPLQSEEPGAKEPSPISGKRESPESKRTRDEASEDNGRHATTTHAPAHSSSRSRSQAVESWGLFGRADETQSTG
jgi:hypothetical protein